MKNKELSPGRFFPEAVGVASCLGLGVIGRWVDYQFHADTIYNLRYGGNPIDMIMAPYQSYTLLSETHPLLARIVEVGAGILIGRIKLVREKLGAN